jgi:hypothetical protein
MLKKLTYHVLEVTTILCHAYMDAVLQFVGNSPNMVLSICLISFVIFTFSASILRGLLQNSRSLR